jgi:hypothetical protein
MNTKKRLISGGLQGFLNRSGILSLFLKKKRYISDRLGYLVISTALPLLWVIMGPWLRYNSQNSKYLPPKSSIFASAEILIGKKDIPIQANHTLLPAESAKSWAQNSMKIPKITVRTSHRDIEAEVLIVVGEWFKSIKPHLKLYLPAFLLAQRVKRKKIPIWFMLGDTYNLHVLIAASILVSICGGAIVLQQNTTEEASRFGIPHPAGPILWLINDGNKDQFMSKFPWKSRNQEIVFGVSGDIKRWNLYYQHSETLNRFGWTVTPTFRQYSWEEYLDLLKRSKVKIVTSLRQEAVSKRLRFLRSRSSEFFVSSRVFEGFCASNLVITNNNPTLQSLNFVPNVHFIDLDEVRQSGFILPDDETLERIATAGNELFLKSLS